MIYRLTGPDGIARSSVLPGTLGGHRKQKIYGRLDCRSALRAIASGRGTYERNRVFFENEAVAVASGYRPCAVCLPVEYAEWKASRT